MDLTVNTNDDQRLSLSLSVLPVSEISQDSTYFSLLGGFLDPSEPLRHLPPHLSRALTSATSEIYTEPTLENFGSSGLSSGHRQTTYLRSLSDSSETDSSTDPMSDLYIFEKETQDFILSSTTQGIKVDNNSNDSLITLCDSTKSVTHSNATNKGWMMLESGLEPPAEVTRLTTRGPRSISPAELWADARQYLDNADALAASASSDLSLEESWVSGYSCDGIGWERDDSRGWGLPVERWSSVESWASALSDWNVIGTPAQELTAAFSEIGAEIDALTEALADIKPYSHTERVMGVVDQPVGQTIQEESIQCGQGCFAFQSQMGDNVHSPANNRAEQEETSKDNFVQEDPFSVSCAHDMDSLISPCTAKEDLDLTQFVQFLGTEEDKIVLKIVEDADVEQPAEMTNEQFLENGVFKVTEDHSVPQPDHLPEQGTELNSSSTDVDSNGLGLSLEDTMKPRVPVFNTDRHALPDILTEQHEESQVLPQGCCPTFIVPVAPLEISSALEYRRSSLEIDQMRPFKDAHAPTWTLWPLCDEAATDEGVHELCKELSNWTVIPEKNHTILDDPHVSKSVKPKYHAAVSKPKPNHGASGKIPNKSEGKPRCKKDKCTVHDHSNVAPKKLENSAHPTTCRQKEITVNPSKQLVEENTIVIETGKVHGKKKKKHHHSATVVKTATELTGETENAAKVTCAKGCIEIFEAKAKQVKVHKDPETPEGVDKKHPEVLKPSQAEHASLSTKHINTHSPTNDDIVKKRRLSKDKFGKPLDLKLSSCTQVKAVEGPNANVRALSKKASSEVVIHKSSTLKEELKVMQPIQATSVSGDPQGLNLWCQFVSVSCEHTITWRQGSALLAEIKRSAGDENRASLTIPNASHKDLGKYQCCLSSSQGSITLDYLLTYEVLREIVILPSPNLTSTVVEAGVEAEEVQCSQLLFKEDFLSEQYFGQNQAVSIITEKAHFGEGMHRRAFRTRLRRGGVPLLLAGPSCVLKVHNAISYGTKNNDDLVKRNFSLAVEECHVQNTAREYIKEYSAAAKSVDAFGEVPEIIPIYLVHRPSSDIPYATLEEELIGDFVKYSVKDGKEINLMRRDSEAGRKCCTFQHWVYQRTDGNLLVTDMQGVGMKLTDVGIATCKKGYRGFKGNCATSFIDQFKVLHQCNAYCEILGLASLQPKAAKKAACSLRGKPQPTAGPKKKTFGPTLKPKP